MLAAMRDRPDLAAIALWKTAEDLDAPGRIRKTAALEGDGDCGDARQRRTVPL
jgi:hypothetical protein